MLLLSGTALVRNIWRVGSNLQHSIVCQHHLVDGTGSITSRYLIEEDPRWVVSTRIACFSWRIILWDMFVHSGLPACCQQPLKSHHPPEPAALALRLLMRLHQSRPELLSELLSELQRGGLHRPDQAR